MYLFDSPANGVVMNGVIMKLAFVLFAVVAMAFASSTIRGEAGGFPTYTLPSTDDILDTYAYNLGEQLSSIGASFDDYAAVDDYNGINANIEMYTLWGVTTGVAPTALEIIVVADDGGVPSASGPTSQVSYPTVCTNSGMTYGGYTIWVAAVDLSGAPLNVTAPVWIGSHRNDTDTWYPVAGTTVTGSEAYRTIVAGWTWLAYSSQDPYTAADLFKVIEGAPTSLSRSTWAGIKNNF